MTATRQNLHEFSDPDSRARNLVHRCAAHGHKGAQRSGSYSMKWGGSLENGSLYPSAHIGQILNLFTRGNVPRSRRIACQPVLWILWHTQLPYP